MKSIALAAFLSCGAVLAADSTDPQISGPYTHENLSVFLIHGASAARAPHYVPLKDAMETGKVIVHETRNVNQLAIENVSNDTVFIQGGDIVKGGQQDRTLTNDFFLPPRSGRIAISAFCVEHGRWTQRGSEPVQTFSVSDMIAPAAVKSKVVAGGNQQQVWAGVAQVQVEVASIQSNGAMARSASPSSLQLTLENPAIQKATAAYVKDIVPATKRTHDVVGAIFAINGNPVGADLYSSAELFSAVWPKLVNSMAFEAVRGRREGEWAPLDPAAARAFIETGDGGQTVNVDKRTSLTRQEIGKRIVIESRDDGRWIHRSVLMK